jgi:hypothetical protein
VPQEFSGKTVVLNVKFDLGTIKVDSKPLEIELKK